MGNKQIKKKKKKERPNKSSKSNWSISKGLARVPPSYKELHTKQKLEVKWKAQNGSVLL